MERASDSQTSFFEKEGEMSMITRERVDDKQGEEHLVQG
jgi:hypothetical protein